MWCILCCQHQTREDNKCPEREITRPLESHKPDSSELVALISPTNGVHMDTFNETTTVDNSLVTGRSILDDGRDRTTIKTNLGTNHTSTLEKTKLGPVLNDTMELIKPARTSEPAATTTIVTTNAAITTVTTNPNPAPLSTEAENPVSSKRSHRAHRTEGMSVSFSTPDEREMRDRSTSHPSATGRPIWTLKDVFDSPYTYGPTNNGNPDELIISLSQPKTIHEETKSTNSADNTHCENYKLPECNSDLRLTRRHTRPGSLYHPHSTFFLPRISTDPSTGHNTLDHAYMANGKPFPIRRGSMIVRSGRTTSSSSNVQSGAIEQSSVGAPAMGVEGFIVTPFAQVLVSMQRIRCAFIRLTATQSSNRYGAIASAVTEPGVADILVPETQEYKSVASETLEELEWCLKQLETIQTKRPVSDMAFSKFKRLLNKELNSFGEADKSRHEISAYICGTFLEDEKDAEANQEIEQMLERRRSSGQSHTSIGTAHDSQVYVTGGRSQSQQQQQQLQSNRTTEKGGDSDLTNAEARSASAQPECGSVEGGGTNLSHTGKTMIGNASSENLSSEAQADLPMHGISTSNDEELNDRFTQYLDTWGIDIFEVDRLSDGHGLVTTTYRIFQQRDLMRIFAIDPATLVRYLIRLEQNYHADVPYHNSLHATDVIQTSHFLLQAEPLEDVFSDLEILAVLFASAVHDVDHPGLTNQFLINTGHDLALQYNDTSVLENHHLYVAFKLLNEPECDLFASLAAKKRQTLRRMVIELVLATDMSKHMSLLADLRTMVETKKVSGSGMLNLDNYSDRIQILQNMIHCADLSNPAKPLRLNRKWTGRLMEEFFRQGDKERTLKLEISPMCDRESVAVEKSQVSFIDFVAHPLLESWCDLVHPSAQFILDTLADNRDWYESQIDGARCSGVTKGRPKLSTANENDEELVNTS